MILTQAPKIPYALHCMHDLMLRDWKDNNSRAWQTHKVDIVVRRNAAVVSMLLLTA